jgi:hypothetical protein
MSHTLSEEDRQKLKELKDSHQSKSGERKPVSELDVDLDEYADYIVLSSTCTSSRKKHALAKLEAHPLCATCSPYETKWIVREHGTKPHMEWCEKCIRTVAKME